MHHREKLRGFTLVEMLVVMAIVAVLISVLMPSLAAARRQARALMCLSNLRQINVATHMYLENNNDTYPVAQWSELRGGTFYIYAWDYTTLKEPGPGGQVLDVVGGLVWRQDMVSEIQQCPEFRGRSNWLEDPHTGYNYNTSYIGHGQWENIPEPASRGQVRRPSDTALFGDGQYAGGANKFMRAPWPNPADEHFYGRYAGTQGFRHRGATNVAFCDGHAATHKERFTDTSPTEQQWIAAGTGFLSADNTAYDLGNNDQ